jgi:hypothetical protein
MTTCRPRAARTGRAALFILVLAAALCGGCAGRFSAHTEYVAAGFGRGSLRGHTVAVMPPAGGDFAREVRGVTRGLGQAGARVVVLAPPDETDDDAADRSAVSAARGARVAYVLIVRPARGEVYRSYARHSAPDPTGERSATRTSGRRVGLRLALLRASDGAAVWLARGTGEMWQTRTAAPATADTVGADLAGHPHLYPPPPPPHLVSDRHPRPLGALIPEPVVRPPR